MNQHALHNHIMKKKLLANLSYSKSNYNLRRVTTNASNEEIIDAINKRANNPKQSIYDYNKNVVEEDNNNNNNSSFRNSYNNISYNKINIKSNYKPIYINSSNNNDNISSEHNSCSNINNNTNTNNSITKNIEYYSSIKKKLNKHISQNNIYCDAAYLSYDDALSKKKLTIKKMQSPKRNKYFKEKLRHDILPFSRVDNEDYKESLISILRNNIHKNKIRKEAINSVINSSSKGSVTKNKSNNENKNISNKRACPEMNNTDYFNNINSNKSFTYLQNYSYKKNNKGEIMKDKSIKINTYKNII